MYTIKEMEKYDKERFVRFNYEWIEEQLSGSSLSTDNRKLVIGLLNEIERSNIPTALSLSTVIDTVLSAVESLALGHPIVEEEDEGTWVPVTLGEIFKRDIVKLRNDAYVGDIGIKLNGRIGRVVSTTGGRIRVVLDGDDPESALGHAPEILLKKM